MGGLTPPKKRSASKVRCKSFKCTVEVLIHAVICPGVVLPSTDSVYLRVRLMGQDQQTECVPPAFPLLLHEKLLFTKMFTKAVDPCDVTDHLQNDTTSLELIQLVPPEGKTLAIFKSNTRDFLYPKSRLVLQTRGSKREIVMKVRSSFLGISPKVELSTMSIIEECSLKARQSSYSRSSLPTSKTSLGTLGTSGRHKTINTEPSCGYLRPTVASLSRSPAPYTHRRMCQLTDEAAQRLHHLQLGPYTFKKETTSQPPFVVPHSPDSSFTEYTSMAPSSPKRSFFLKTNVPHSPDSSFTEYTSMAPSSPKRSFFLRTNVSGHSMNTSCTSPKRTSTQLPGSPSTLPPAYYSTPLSNITKNQSPLFTGSTLRERFRSPSQSEEIHNRVQRILRSDGARCKLTFDEQSDEPESGQKEPVSSSHYSPCDSQLKPDRVIPGEPSVHLDDGTFWTNMAAKYTGTPHRAVFGDSLSEIYKNLYRRASASQLGDSHRTSEHSD